MVHYRKLGKKKLDSLITLLPGPSTGTTAGLKSQRDPVFAIRMQTFSKQHFIGI